MCAFMSSTSTLLDCKQERFQIKWFIYLFLNEELQISPLWILTLLNYRGNCRNLNREQFLRICDLCVLTEGFMPSKFCLSYIHFCILIILLWGVLRRRMWSSGSAPKMKDLFSSRSRRASVFWPETLTYSSRSHLRGEITGDRLQNSIFKSPRRDEHLQY